MQIVAQICSFLRTALLTSTCTAAAKELLKNIAEAAPAEAAPYAEVLPSAPKASWFELSDLSRYGVGYIDKAFAWLRGLPLAKWLDKGDDGVGVVSTWAAALFGVVFFIASIVVASKMSAFNVFWTGLGGLLASALAIYCGPKMVNSLRVLVKNSEGRLGSQTLTDSLAAIFLFFSVTLLIMGFTELFSKYGSAMPKFIWALVTFLAGIAFAVPGLVSTTVGAKCSPAQELFSLVQFFLKIVLRVIPYIWTGVMAYMGFKPGQKLLGTKVDYVFLGACTNGRIEDFRAFASIARGRHKADGVVAWLVPGSWAVSRQIAAEGLDRVLAQAGFEIRQPGCSACLAMNDDKIPSGKLCVSTSNRNFEGRQGPGSRTILASPLVAAAAAVTGRITDPRPLIP